MKFWIFVIFAASAVVNALIGTQWIILPIPAGWPTTLSFLLAAALCGTIAYYFRKNKSK